MMRKVLLYSCLVSFIATMAHCQGTGSAPTDIVSPNGKNVVSFELINGAPTYKVQSGGRPVFNTSRMGFVLKDTPPLDKGFRVIGVKKSTFDQVWEQPWGEVKKIRNNYTQTIVDLQEEQGLKRKMSIIFRVFNDGFGFRYVIPEQEHVKDFVIMDELTEFAVAADPMAWWIPAYGPDMDTEYLFRHSSVSALTEKVCTPLTMEGENHFSISIHEAALVDYASMTLQMTGNRVLKCDLVPWSNGDRVVATAPMQTPWRSVQIADQPGDLVTSYLVLNLNEPNKIGDVSWINPGKYNGMWWGMHVKKYTWEGGPNHGATTANMKVLIDFAAKHHISAVLAEGWNEGWEGDWTVGGNFSFTKPYPDYDLDEITRYAKARNISIIAHHETGGNVRNYENQMEDAFKLCEKYGIHNLKTGYVNRLPSGERHQGQFMVRHYQKVMETAARYHVMVDAHEPIKDTGLRRTYPNMMTREGARGTEYEAWSDGNPPEHTAILPFTRCLGGPLDYTPGIFDIQFKTTGNFRVHTTLAKQLALYVVIYSPLQMVADLPENYEGQPALKFIEDVPTDWDDTKVLQAEISKYVTVVRKDRNSGDWFLGGVTDADARDLTVKTDFLSPGKKYVAEIYQDGKDADMTTNPLSLEIKSVNVDAATVLNLHLAPGGGVAIRFHEKK